MWIDFVVAGLLIAAVTLLIIRSVRRRKAGQNGCACSGNCGTCAGCTPPASNSENK